MALLAFWLAVPNLSCAMLKDYEPLISKTQAEIRRLDESIKRAQKAIPLIADAIKKVIDPKIRKELGAIKKELADVYSESAYIKDELKSAKEAIKKQEEFKISTSHIASTIIAVCLIALGYVLGKPLKPLLVKVGEAILKKRKRCE